MPLGDEPDEMRVTILCADPMDHGAALIGAMGDHWVTLRNFGTTLDDYGEMVNVSGGECP